jgi:hypothetical protein
MDHAEGEQAMSQNVLDPDLSELAWRRLIGGVLVQALKEYYRPASLLEQIDALLWLASPDAETFAQALSLDINPALLLTRKRKPSLRKLEKEYEND